MICLDEMGPESAKSHLGTRLVPETTSPPRRNRATQEADYGRRGTGYVFGAFAPATAAAFTAAYTGRTIANWVDFLDEVDGGIADAVDPVYAVLDNLSTHRATTCWNDHRHPFGWGRRKRRSRGRRGSPTSRWSHRFTG